MMAPVLSQAQKMKLNDCESRVFNEVFKLVFNTPTKALFDNEELLKVPLERQDVHNQVLTHDF